MRIEDIEKRLDELAIYQQEKLLKLAIKRIPHLTFDDLLQPFDFEELENDPDFRYEEGLLAGIYAAQAALRAERGLIQEELPPCTRALASAQTHVNC